MTDLDIERACERLVLDFAYFSDRKDYESLAGLFTQEGTMTRPSRETLAGRAAILTAYQERPSTRITRHLCTNIRITVESGERAKGWTYALVFGADSSESPDGQFGRKADTRSLIGEFEDEFHLTPDGWRIASRIARFVMHQS